MLLISTQANFPTTTTAFKPSEYLAGLGIFPSSEIVPTFNPVTFHISRVNGKLCGYETWQSLKKSLNLCSDYLDTSREGERQAKSLLRPHLFIAHGQLSPLAYSRVGQPFPFIHLYKLNNSKFARVRKKRKEETCMIHNIIFRRWARSSHRVKPNNNKCNSLNAISLIRSFGRT